MLDKPESKNDGMGYYPFLLDKHSRDEHSHMQMTFWVNGEKYIMSLEFDSKRIYEESLIVYTSVRPTTLYKRVYQSESDHTEVIFGNKAGIDKATGRAIVCCPGGGYTHLAMQHEGFEWAPFFNEQGIALIVLKYRMPHGNYTVPAEDAEEAMRLVRRNAEAWHINPNDVGIMGFSAGGHLASTVATHATSDAMPNFQILFYPVISMEQGITHQGSRDNLLGKSPKQKLVNEYCNEQHITKNSPRCFLALAYDDRAVPPANSLNYYEQLNAHGVSTSMHIYPSGGHGFGIRQSFTYHFEMMLELKAWLRSF
jgi:acetyl esterase/lipase